MMKYWTPLSSSYQLHRPGPERFFAKSRGCISCEFSAQRRGPICSHKWSDSFFWLTYPTQNEIPLRCSVNQGKQNQKTIFPCKIINQFWVEWTNQPLDQASRVWSKLKLGAAGAGQPGGWAARVDCKATGGYSRVCVCACVWIDLI